jgi:hypothetical protein
MFKLQPPQIGHNFISMPFLLLLLLLFTCVHCFSVSPSINPSRSPLISIDGLNGLNGRIKLYQTGSESRAEVLSEDHDISTQTTSLSRGGDIIDGKGNSFWPRGDSLDKSIFLVRNGGGGEEGVRKGGGGGVYCCLFR